MDTRTIPERINHHRRRFLGSAAMTVAAAQLGMVGSADAQAVATPSKLPAVKPGTHTSFRLLKQVRPMGTRSFFCTDGLTTSTATSM